MLKQVFLAVSLTLALTACQSTPNDKTPNASLSPQVIKHMANQMSQNLRALPRTQTAQFANIAYDTVDERQKMDIYLPNNQTIHAPTVVYIHGGGWIGGDKIEVASSKMGVDKMIARLLDNGYAVVSVDYRFAPDYPMPAQTDDVTKAFEFILKNGQKYGIDTSRLAVMGESAGGHLAQWLSVTQGKHLKASVPFYAVSDVANLSQMVKADPVCQNFSLGKLLGGMGMNVPDDFSIRLLSKPRFLWIFKNLNPNTYKGLFLVWKEI